MNTGNKGSNKESETKNNTPANGNAGNAAGNGNNVNGNSGEHPSNGNAGNSGNGGSMQGNSGAGSGNSGSGTGGGNSSENSNNGNSGGNNPGNGGPSDNGNNGQGSDNEKISLVIVVNSEPVTIVANLHEPLQVVALHALQETGNVGRDLTDWRMKTEAGDVLDFKQKVKYFGFTAGTELFLSLKAGEGGC